MLKSTERRIANIESKVTTQNTPFLAIVDCAENKAVEHTRTRKNRVKLTAKNIESVEGYINQVGDNVSVIIDDI